MIDLHLLRRQAEMAYSLGGPLGPVVINVGQLQELLELAEPEVLRRQEAAYEKK